MNAINKLKSYLHSGSADICVRSHVIALALSLGVPGKLYQLLILPPPKPSCNTLIAIQSRAPASSEILDDPPVHAPSNHVQYLGPYRLNHANLITIYPVLFLFCSWRRRFWGSWRGVLILLPDVEGSGAPGEEFWFCFLTWKVLGLLARSSGSASWRGRFWGSWRRISVLLLA